MASILKSQPNAAVAQTKVVVLQAGAQDTNTVIGLLCSNTSTSDQHASVYLRRASVDYSIITNGAVPANDTLAAVGEDGKVVMMPNDAIVAVCDTGTMDVIVSYLNQTP